MLNNREILGSELKDKIELYSELTGENGWSVPVAKVADFISGFEMGKERFRKRGHWIEVIDEIDSLGNKTWHHKCSICGNENSGWGNYKYCPDCGAKMESEGI